MNTDLRLGEFPLDSLLNERKYARLARFLLDLQTAVGPTDQSNLKNITSTALQICMFCQQCQTEMEWHRKANREVQLRLNELDGQLDTLLNLILEYESHKETQHPAVSVSVTLLEDRISPMGRDHHNLWQRIRDLFKVEPKPSNSERQMTKVVVNTSIPSAVEKGERVTHLTNIDKELPPQITTEIDTLAPSTTYVSTPTQKLVETFEQVNTPATSITDLDIKDASAVPIVETAHSGASPPSLVVYCLGSFRVFLDDHPIDDWSSSKGKAIFKYLIMHREHNIAKDILMDLFWPEACPNSARNNLNVAIYGLRQAFRTVTNMTVVELEGGTYRLNPKIKVWIDMEAFEGHLQTAHRLEIMGDLDLAVKEMELAANLYRGDFLVDDIYDDWTILTRERLRLVYVDTLDRISQISFSREDYSTSVRLCQLILQRDNCREDAHRRLIRCYCRQGQRHLALRQFRLCEDALRNELGIDPEPATIELIERIRT